MRAVLDACVLYPTVLREILLGVADAGLITPIWSERLLEEWRRAAEKQGGAQEAAWAAREIAGVGCRFPDALHPPGEAAALWLPDPADIYVLATAVAAKAELIVTLNLRDFPSRELNPHGIVARAPDAVLMDLWLDAGPEVEAAVAATHGAAERAAGRALDLRALLKRARLPRLGKALAGARMG